ncbi:hypothetical protein SUGI_0632270 [Cryptomeria japonica]|nr:hypothetical protein SUGI_0632270 [Cryptomeria japonica]
MAKATSTVMAPMLEDLFNLPPMLQDFLTRMLNVHSTVPMPYALHPLRRHIVCGGMLTDSGKGQAVNILAYYGCSTRKIAMVEARYVDVIKQAVAMIRRTRRKEAKQPIKITRKYITSTRKYCRRAATY